MEIKLKKKDLAPAPDLLEEDREVEVHKDAVLKDTETEVDQEKKEQQEEHTITHTIEVRKEDWITDSKGHHLIKVEGIQEDQMKEMIEALRLKVEVPMVTGRKQRITKKMIKKEMKRKNLSVKFKLFLMTEDQDLRKHIKQLQPC